MKRYRLATGADRDKFWRQPRQLAGTVTDVTTMLRAWDNEESRLKKRGKHQEFGAWKRTFQMGVALSRALRASRIGDYFVIVTKSGRELAIRVVEVDPPVSNTEGTNPVDECYADITTRFQGVENWGICSCRDIGSTSVISQHAYCNAWDIHASQTVMEQIFHYLIANADRLHVHTVIFNHRIWSRERPYIHEYIVPPGGDAHETHDHVDFDPQSPGSPC